MNNYELDSSKLFNANLEAALAGLATTWGVSSDNNPAIEEVRKAAHFNVIGRTSLRLVRMANLSPFEEHRSFFEGLTAKEYSPHLYGTEIKQGTSEHAQAKKLLKDFAHYVGHTVIREQTAKLASATRSKDPAWLESGLVPTDNGIVVTDTGLSHEDIDWGAQTIPADLPQDELSKLRDETSRMTEIIKGASPSDARTYLKTTLRARFVEVINELKDRREKYTNQTSFEIKEGALIDFKASLLTVMQQALEKMATPRATKQDNVAPYPTLVADNDVAVATAKKIDPSRIKEQLKALQTRIDGYTNQLSGEALKQFYNAHLIPKQASLLSDVFKLSHAGNDPAMLDIKERHLDVIQAGMAVVLNKINAEMNNELRAREAAAKPAAPVATPVVAPVVAKAPPANIVDFPTLTEIITPGPAAVAEAAFLITAAQDRARETLRKSPAATTMIELPKAAAASPAPIQIGYEDDGITTVDFKEVIPQKKPDSWLKKAAVKVAVGTVWAVGAAAVAVVGIFGGTMAAIKYQDHVRDAKIAAAATAQFNQAAEATAAQRAVDVAKETGYYSPMTTPAATVAAPAAEIVAPVEVVKAETAKTVEAKQPASEPKVAKAPSAVKVKADFKPAAAVNDDQVTYTNAIIAKPFDIATSRVGLDTWNGACSTLKARGVTVSSDVCPS